MINSTLRDRIWQEAPAIFYQAFRRHANDEQCATIARWLEIGGCVAVKPSKPEMKLATKRYIEFLPALLT